MNKRILVICFIFMANHVMALDTSTVDISKTSDEDNNQIEPSKKGYLERIKTMFKDDDGEENQLKSSANNTEIQQKEIEVIGINHVRETRTLCGKVASSFFSFDNELKDEPNKEQISTPFKLLEPHWPLEPGDLIKLSDKTKKQLATIYKSFGEPTNTTDYIGTEQAGNSFVKHTFIVKYEKTALRYTCVFYKPKDLWFVHSIHWDNMVSLLFK